MIDGSSIYGVGTRVGEQAVEGGLMGRRNADKFTNARDGSVSGVVDDEDGRTILGRVRWSKGKDMKRHGHGCGWMGGLACRDQWMLR